ncbi:NAD(P)/FAD-dependent oxidoreductase [Halosegnis rubeus]|jgi:NADH dehydrogenase|uniref:NAD(P)/FAD-dependent oxidoreductase n=1 Tax=Halosegnis rubeus TaxID=2212850 RepID=A0A5N5UGP6_9EURY|nr:FAD-dependent oxidoreductase [Halosegnis rubeus]KAB7513010.1 NAD(P)/FAD-dependent oxidoreductase [Halosegnis rubeus]KAB7513132.1 NAD(P)/FAD-dependent oxidoreductase [Halosegnis rubeus]KAB7516622.1 NAD(P)/FAD-dependent oxidoreductase [Halosegnis rubeus]
MTDDIVVLGSGYAGTGAVKRLEDELDGEADLTWISDVDHHLVLHESHRVIRDPSVRDKVTFDCESLKAPSTRFINERVDALDTDERTIELADGSTVDYDYVLVAFGSQTAFFGIDGLREHSLTLKSLDDALEIHDAVKDAAAEATTDDPAHVVVGGAGLSGIQSAGEIAQFRDRHRAPIDISLVEGLDNVFPNNDPVVQAKLTKLLEAADIDVLTGEFIGEVDEETVYVGDDTELDYDVLLWTGGITGQDAAQTVDVEQDERSHRINSEHDFTTSDERVFAIGDAALIDQPGDENPAPPTAQAAWQAAEVAGLNLARTVRGQPLETWQHEDKGTLISVGDDAVAHNVVGVNEVVETFGGLPAELLKKTVAARWINDVAGLGAAARAFPDM